MVVFKLYICMYWYVIFTRFNLWVAVARQHKTGEILNSITFGALKGIMTQYI